MLAALTSALVLALTPAPMRADSVVRVMSYNIRYNNPGDGVHAWPHRADRVANLIRYHAPDLFGLQEALVGQIEDLTARLPHYAWFGVGRDDGRAVGEGTPIFYRRDRFVLLAQGTFWLSETPEVPGSKGWDAAITRIATWGRFQDRRSGARFVFLNTHFDHMGQQAREHSARLILDRLRTLADGLPAIVAGDFNITPDNPAYATLAGALEDARLRAVEPPHGPAETFFGFTVEPGAPGRRIDYVFVSPGVRTLRYATLTDQYHGHYPSDHVPVVADVVLGR